MIHFISVVILSVRGALVRKFMLVAHSLGMTRGDWIFLDVEIFQVSISVVAHDFTGFFLGRSQPGAC